MAMGIVGFVLVFTVLGIPMVVLAVAASERVPTVAPAPRTERAGLVLVILCFFIPVVVALLRSVIA